jgi:single-stranded DNA-binding protein
MIVHGKFMTIGAGRLTRDPEVKMVGADKDKKLVKFGIAVGEGDAKDFIDAVCWRRQADYAETLKKADEVFFIGIDKTRTYEGRDGEEKSKTETEIRWISKQPMPDMWQDEPPGGYHNSSTGYDGMADMQETSDDMPF